MKIHILFPFTTKPWGGGNQFLRGLKNEFSRRSNYSDNPQSADVILFNSHQHPTDILRLKRHYPDKVFVHRVDGPISLVRGRDTGLDRIIYDMNQIVANGTVFQSQWSQQENTLLGMKQKRPAIVIPNAPDPDIFYPPQDKPVNSGKVRLIATSWSPNRRKGFDIYRFLDSCLDFSRFSMAFYGNSPFPFKNIKLFDPVPSDVLAKALRSADIFITASSNDPCSNSLLEAIFCGCRIVARDSGGHPELVGNRGILFQNEKDILEIIDQVTEHVIHNDPLPPYSGLDLPAVADQYQRFAERVSRDSRSGIAPSVIDYLRICQRILLHKIRERFCLPS